VYENNSERGGDQQEEWGIRRGCLLEKVKNEMRWESGEGGEVSCYLFSSCHERGRKAFREVEGQRRGVKCERENKVERSTQPGEQKFGGK